MLKGNSVTLICYIHLIQCAGILAYVRADSEMEVAQGTIHQQHACILISYFFLFLRWYHGNKLIFKALSDRLSRDKWRRKNIISEEKYMYFFFHFMHIGACTLSNEEVSNWRTSGYSFTCSKRQMIRLAWHDVKNLPVFKTISNLNFRYFFILSTLQHLRTYQN